MVIFVIVYYQLMIKLRQAQCDNADFFEHKLKILIRECKELQWAVN